MKTIYKRIKEECPQYIVGNHESDLYILKNEHTTRIINEQRELGEILSVTEFTTTGMRVCYDIAFAFDPFWEKVANKCNLGLNK